MKNQMLCAQGWPCPLRARGLSHVHCSVKKERVRAASPPTPLCAQQGTEVRPEWVWGGRCSSAVHAQACRELPEWLQEKLREGV